MILSYLKRKHSRKIARITLLIMAFQLLYPLQSLALTSGPSQPEMQSFEPVGTTDMVNLFTGDFNYNIPLLDVEGYPVNIAYKSGISMEEESTWVGLGWNINVGNINHIIRGLSDDYNGEVVEKYFDINPEVKKRYQFGFGIEYVGFPGNLPPELKKHLKINSGGNIGFGINISNYTGVSADFSNQTGGSASNQWFSGGLQLGSTISTSEGVDVNYNFSGSVKSGQMVNTAVNGSFGQGFNSREGLKYTSFGVSPSISMNLPKSNESTCDDGSIESKKNFVSGGFSHGIEGMNNSFVPISLQNFVPVITNQAFINSTFFQLKLGVELNSLYINVTGSYGEDKVTVESDGNKRAFGYLNLQNATADDMVDFTRDRDGRYNRMMQYLPPANMTYDLYTVNGQGTMGNFRPFRNDIGTVYDPIISTYNKSGSDLVEIGAGNIFEAGWDRIISTGIAKAGPWTKYKSNFRNHQPNSDYEPYYFKQAGELSLGNEELKNAIKDYTPLRTRKKIGNGFTDEMISVLSGSSSLTNRNLRSNLIYHFTAEEASDPQICLTPKIESYHNHGPAKAVSKLNRVNNYRKPHQISEISQILPDGRRYNFGIAAMNITQKEYVVSCDAPTLNNGIANCDTNAVQGDPDFGQKMKLRTTTPPFAHSYLLTSVLSPDYTDVTGNGISDDDLGAYTKFNYSFKDAAYHWRTPYEAHTGQFDQGVKSDCHDDRATFIAGTKEIWMLHSIETRNYIAEFHTSPRIDGRGYDNSEGILPTNGTNNVSYKLDKIVLYNKQDRAMNGDNAYPIKTVLFTYDYTLCLNAPNSQAGKGKLTLKSISIKNGNSDIGLLSPYRFEYSGLNPDYSQTAKDVWGNYKPDGNNNMPTSNLHLDLTNHEFPYINQTDPNLDTYASVWSLNKIHLPSGGEINIEYESDDYSMVQDKRAMEMFQVEGVGSSPAYAPGRELFKSAISPNLYLYFKLKTQELYPGDISKSYLDGKKLVQYTFEVDISPGEKTESCPNTPLTETVKGYATVVESGTCTGNSTYGYLKLEQKTASSTAQLKTLKVGDIKLNPIHLTALNYTRYYNNKALYPSSDMVKANAGELIEELLKTSTQVGDYVLNPLRRFIKKEKGKYCNLNKSYIRLCSQGFKKGGGHRVHKIQFSDVWDDIANANNATYGSEYDYSMAGPSGQSISSGVASYEPILGGNENPFKEPVATDIASQDRKFPVVDPIELTVEGPLGETMYPSGVVGYSKVTVRSIHQDKAESSQLEQVHEFYTAADFPVKVEYTEIEKIEDRPLKKSWYKMNKFETLRLAQGYTLFFNDMHGKLKGTTTYENKNGTLQEVAYKRYTYFTSNEKTLNNNVPVLNSLVPGNPQVVTKELGVEADFTADSREKEEFTQTKGQMVNINTFMFGTVPVPLPSAFPKRPKSVQKTFSSIVNTKVVQRYGILKSIETKDKGATIILSNEVFDPITGSALITKVSTEHLDVIYDMKIPAYYAYKNMGGAYENILYEETIDGNASIVDDVCYIYSDHLNRFKTGDELIIDIDKSCIGTNNLTADDPERYKLWVEGKTTNQTPNVRENIRSQCNPNNTCNNFSNSYSSPNPNPNGFNLNDAVIYNYKVNCANPPQNGTDEIHNACAYLDEVRCFLDFFVRDNNLSTYLNSNPPEKIEFENLHQITPPSTFLLPLSNSGSLNNKYFKNSNGVVLQNSGIFYNFGCQTHAHTSNGNTNHFLVHGISMNGEIKNLSAYPNGAPQLYTTPNVRKVEYIIKLTPHFWAIENQVNQNSVTNPNTFGNPYLNYLNMVYEPTQFLKNIDCDLPGNADNFLNHTSNTNKIDLGSPLVDYPYYKITLYFPDNGSSPQSSNLPIFKYLTELESANLENSANGQSFGSVKIGSMNANSFTTEYDVRRINEFKIEQTSSVVIPRIGQGLTYNNTPALICKPLKRGALSSKGLYKPFPSNDTIYSAKIKIIRSGNRNLLNETIQEVSSLSNPVDGNTLNTTINKALSASAKTFTDKAIVPNELLDPVVKYFNPFITGQKGNYRILQEFVQHKMRDYAAVRDTRKGFYHFEFFWISVGTTLDEYYNKLKPPTTLANNWYAKTKVDAYSPWGADLQVTDASGNKHSNLFGYSNRMPVAVVSNCGWNNALYENFEDYDVASHRYIFDMPDANMYFYQNAIKSHVLNLISNGTTELEIVQSDFHTGKRSLKINTLQAISIPVSDGLSGPASNPDVLHPFYLRPDMKYILSFWRKLPVNSNPTGSGLTITLGTNSVYFNAKTPNIEGWVLYEGAFTVPSNLNNSNVVLNLPAGLLMDDIRIMPGISNMKSYVYHPINKRLVAVLDENHMATIFEYTPEGKLARIKKETEKGHLTIKESRESLRAIINASGTSSVLLADPAYWVPNATQGSPGTSPYYGLNNNVLYNDPTATQ